MVPCVPIDQDERGATAGEGRRNYLTHLTRPADSGQHDRAIAKVIRSGCGGQRVLIHLSGFGTTERGADGLAQRHDCLVARGG